MVVNYRGSIVRICRTLPCREISFLRGMRLAAMTVRVHTTAKCNRRNSATADGHSQPRPHLPTSHLLFSSGLIYPSLPQPSYLSSILLPPCPRLPFSLGFNYPPPPLPYCGNCLHPWCPGRSTKSTGSLYTPPRAGNVQSCCQHSVPVYIAVCIQ